MAREFFMEAMTVVRQCNKLYACECIHVKRIALSAAIAEKEFMLL